MNKKTSRIDTEAQNTARSKTPFDNDYAIEDQLHRELGAYVGQNNLGVAHFDPIILEKDRSEINKSPRKFLEKTFGDSTDIVRKSALATMDIGNAKTTAFTQQFSNTWLTTSEMMFKDTTLNSDIAKRDREARGMLYRLEK